MPDPSGVGLSLTKISIPATMIGTIIGGSAWLTSIKVDVAHLQTQVKDLRVEYQDTKKRVYDKVAAQDQRLSRMEGKLDSINQNLNMLLRRMNAERRRQ